MKHYSKEFKEEALKLSDEIGVKKAAQQLGIAYYTLADWRSIRRNAPPQAGMRGFSCPADGGKQHAVSIQSQRRSVKQHCIIARHLF